MPKEDTLNNSKVISIRLRWFGMLAEHRGKRAEELTISQGATGMELLDALSQEMPVINDYRPYIRLAVNQEYTDENTPLSENDEVALITPVSGG